MECKHLVIQSCVRYPAHRCSSPEGQRSVCGLVLNVPSVFILCECTTLGEGSSFTQSCASVCRVVKLQTALIDIPRSEFIRFQFQIEIRAMLCGGVVVTLLAAGLLTLSSRIPGSNLELGLLSAWSLMWVSSGFSSFLTPPKKKHVCR